MVISSSAYGSLGMKVNSLLESWTFKNRSRRQISLSMFHRYHYQFFTSIIINNWLSPLWLSCLETLTALRVVTMQNAWISTRPSAKSCTSVWSIPSTSTGWAENGSRAALRRTKGCWWMWSLTWPSNVICHPEKQPYPGLHQIKGEQKVILCSCLCFKNWKVFCLFYSW